MNKIVKYLSIVAILMLAFSFSVNAQTSTNSGFTISSLFQGGFGTNFEQAAKLGVGYIEGVTNNGVVTVEGGALVLTKDKQVGGFLDVYFPVGGTNSAFGAGFGLAYLDNNFYNATINGKIGKTYELPLINIPVYLYSSAGGGYNIGKGDAIAEAFAGGLINIPITSDQDLTIGGAAGTISDINGTVLAIGGSYTWHF